MTSLRTRILSYLREHPEGVDDDELAIALQLKYRQQANARCRQLVAEGLVVRQRVNGKICNFLTQFAQSSAPIALSITQEDEHEKAWFWEGNVQEVVVHFLKRQAYAIASTANTATKEQGKDIVAYQGKHLLWVTVKGYPRGTLRTSPSLQAGHWFKHAVFDIIAYRGENEDVELGIALPDYPRYRKMSGKIKWFQQVANFKYFWVNQDGKVEVEEP
jgi:hypothetical protein